MNDISKSIGYARYSSNALTGCLHGCPFCYARRIANRFKPRQQPERPMRDGIVLAEPGDVFPHGFAPTFYQHRLGEPAKVKTPARVFVGDMCDLWGGWVPSWVQDAVLAACAAAPWHTYLMLTKSPWNYDDCLPPYVWPGTTVTTRLEDERLQWLSIVGGGGVRWVSFEPLLEDVSDLAWSGWGLGWVIVGAQTGPRAVAPEPAWIERIVNRCESEGLSLWMKDNLAPYWTGPLIQQAPAKEEGEKDE